jgi:hypothetical protein
MPHIGTSRACRQLSSTPRNCRYISAGRAPNEHWYAFLCRPVVGTVAHPGVIPAAGGAAAYVVS